MEGIRKSLPKSRLEGADVRILTGAEETEVVPFLISHRETTKRTIMRPGTARTIVL